MASDFEWNNFSLWTGSTSLPERIESFAFSNVTSFGDGFSDGLEHLVQ
jgi:hypothetical protein